MQYIHIKTITNKSIIDYEKKTSKLALTISGRIFPQFVQLKLDIPRGWGVISITGSASVDFYPTEYMGNPPTYNVYL